MDSITHIALGAVAGEAIAGRKLGRKAMVYGAIAQSIPDIDFVGAVFLHPVDNLLFHRGITHSIFFALVASGFLAWLFNRWNRGVMDRLQWFAFIFFEICVHLLTDSCNAYGIGLFEPLSDYRLSFHLLFVLDPFFSFVPVAAMLLLLVIRHQMLRNIITLSALIMPILYASYAIYNKRTITSAVEKNIALYSKVERVMITPTAFNTWLWYVVAEYEDHYQVAYGSVFDTKELEWTTFPKNTEWLLKAPAEEGISLVKFSQGYFTISKIGERLVFNDLRFGQVAGWRDNKAPFTFYYFLNEDREANLTVMQRGRLSGWTPESIRALAKRIQGQRSPR